MSTERKIEDVLDVEHFDILVETDLDEPGFLDEMVSGFENNGREALNQMHEAIESVDFEKIKFFSHKLKKLSGTLGAKLLMLMASEIEHLAYKEENLDDIKKILKDSRDNFELCLDYIKKRSVSHE